MNFPIILRLFRSVLPANSSTKSPRRRITNRKSLVQAEALEIRTLLTAFIVNTTLDAPANGSGVTDGFVSLREAIKAANTNAVFGDAAAGSGTDTITFASSLTGQIITLGGEALEITEALTIEGLGANALTINANSQDRIFTINSAGDVTISKLKVTGGDATNSWDPDPLNTSMGGGILNYDSNLTLNNVTVFNNVSKYGAGIFNYGTGVTANMVINNSDIINNTASIHGGGIYATAYAGAGTVEINETTIDSNTASSSGGGLYAFIGLVYHVSNSTISNNHADQSGGGIRLVSAGTSSFVNTTISGNTTNVKGGGVYAESSPVNITNSTITGNRSNNDGFGTGDDGGGIYVDSSTVALKNSIVAGNYEGIGSTASDADDIFGSLSGNFNIIGSAATAGSLVNNVDDNLVGVAGAGVRAIATILDTNLVNNGGDVRTHKLVTGSVAINSGSDALALDRNGTALVSDSRGTPYARLGQGGTGVSATVDRGAFELQPLFVVNTLSDETNNDDTLSLREAITQANAQQLGSLAGGLRDVIRFDASLSQGIIGIGTELSITDAVEIKGLGSTLLTISGGGDDRIFNIDLVNAPAEVKITGVRLEEGYADGDGVDVNGGNDGGAIYNQDANLFLSDVYFLDNQADDDGGAIYSASGSLYVINSVFDGNYTDGSGGNGGAIFYTSGNSWAVISSSFMNNAAEDGGAINNSNSILNIQGSLFTANTAREDGGAIHNNSPDNGDDVTIVNSTFSQNSANSDGGAIFQFDSELVIRNSTITGNRANADAVGGGVGGAIWIFNDNSTKVTVYNSIIAGNFEGSGTTAGEIASKNLEAISSNNIIGHAGSAGGLTNGTNSNIVGVDVARVLDTTLRDNGGKTKTHALLAGSVAINAGSNAQAVNQDATPLVTDQRGTGFTRIKQAKVDIGAYEGFVYRRDSIASNVNGNWWVSKPNFAGTYATTKWAAWPNNNYRKVVQGDFNGDGLQDVAAWLPNGEWRVGLAHSSGVFTYQKWTKWRTTGIKEIHVGDFDNDGKDDIAAMFKRGSKGDWWIARSTGTKFTASKWGTWGNYNGIEKVLLGNFDGINGPDIAVETKGGAWWLALNANTKFVTRKWATWDLSAGVNHYQVGDFDGNGKDDIAGLVGTGLFRDWRVGLSATVGNKFNSSNWTKWKISQSLEGVVAGDFDGDGDTDLAGLFNQKDWWVSRANTNTFVNEKWAVWNFASNGLSDIQVGSSNTDGKQDIFARRNDNGQWKALQSTGAAFATLTLDTWNSASNWQHVMVGNFYNPPAAVGIVAPGAPVASSFVNEEESDSASVPTSRWIGIGDSTENQSASLIQEDSNSKQSSPSKIVQAAEAENYEVFGSQELLDLLHAI